MRVTQLQNGLRLVVHPRPTVPLVAIYLWVETGSMDERADEHGGAHFLEHMLFKGTPRRGLGVAAATIESLGGDLNAFTSYDNTVLHATVESSGWREALDVLVDMARNAIVDPDELERERDVILEEIRGYASDPDDVLSDKSQEGCWPDHPLGRPIVATVAEVSALKREHIVGYWAREWGAQRMILSVAGDVNEAEVHALAEQLLGDLDTGVPRTAPPPTPLPKGPVAQRVASEFDSLLVDLSWRVCDLHHADAPALEVLALALGDGPAAMVPERLLLKDRLISDPWAGTTFRREGGVLSLGFVPRPGRTAEAVSRALQELERIRAEGVDDDVIDRTRSGVLADFLFAAETVDGLAAEDAWYTANYGQPEARAKAREELSRVTVEDVDRVIRTWLTPDRLVVTTVDSALEPEALHAAMAHGVHTQSVNPKAPIDTVLSNGIRLMVQPDDGDVVAISAVMLGGGLLIDSGRAGMCAAWSDMITAGAAGLDAGEFSAAVDRTGGTLSGASGRSTTQLHGRFPRFTGIEGVRLALQALASPTFDADAWLRVQEELLQDVETVQDTPSWVAERALWRALWPGHAWRYPVRGTVSNLQRITTRSLRRWHERHLFGGNIVLSVTGPVSSAKVMRLAKQLLRDVPDGDVDLDLRDAPPPPKTRVLERTCRGEQAVVLIGSRGLAVDHPQRAAARVLAAVLGSQGGRLFLDLRESQSLAYNVWAESIEGWSAGVFHTGLACDPDRVTEATDALLAALDDVVRNPPTDEEVSRAVRMIRGGRAVSLQRASGRSHRLASMARFGMPTDLDQAWVPYAKITPEDVAQIARELLEQPRIIVRVRPTP